MQDIRLIRPDQGLPETLFKLHDPPSRLYLRGELPEGRSVAVVGTRKMTPYGASVAGMASETLVRLGITVVSGLALGIDGKAHTAALGAGGKTVAVLGSGVDDASIYPRLHFRLAQEILKAGHALISEYPPGSGCRKHHFHARNRLIAGLSEAVLVIEAPRRSGAMMTARLALENGRDVWAVPGAITHPNSEGPNALIMDGATPITCPEDIADALGLELEKAILEVDEREADMLDALRDGCDTMDAIALRMGESPRTVAALLAELELRGVVRALGGGRYSLYTALYIRRK